MPYTRIIPSLLLSGNRLVKGRYFADWQAAGAPGTTIRAHNFQKADEIVMLDIDASRTGQRPLLRRLQPLAYEAELPLVVGGGIKSLTDAETCFASGADKIAIGSGLQEAPGLLGRIAAAFGAQAIVANIDIVQADEGYALFDYRTRTTMPEHWLDFAKRMVAAGAGEIRLTRADREGTRAGLDSDAWLALRECVDVPIILEGGAADLDDVLRAARAGVDSIALGTMLVFSDNNIIQVKRHLKNAGIPVRL